MQTKLEQARGTSKAGWILIREWLQRKENNNNATIRKRRNGDHANSKGT